MEKSLAKTALTEKKLSATMTFSFESDGVIKRSLEEMAVTLLK